MMTSTDLHGKFYLADIQRMQFLQILLLVSLSCFYLLVLLWLFGFNLIVSLAFAVQVFNHLILLRVKYSWVELHLENDGMTA